MSVKYVSNLPNSSVKDLKVVLTGRARALVEGSIIETLPLIVQFRDYRYITSDEQEIKLLDKSPFVGALYMRAAEVAQTDEEVQAELASVPKADAPVKELVINQENASKKRLALLRQREGLGGGSKAQSGNIGIKQMGKAPDPQNPEQPAAAPQAGLAALSRNELAALAKGRKVKGAKSMNKEQLLAALVSG